MESKKEKNKSWFIITGSLLFVLGASLITYNYLSNKTIDNKEQEALEDFYKEEIIIEPTIDTPKKEEVKEQIKVEYVAVLKIPKINLERGLVDPNSYLNNVNYNLEFIKGTSMPDEKNGNVIIVGHSGSARTSYFKKLDQLSIGDSASLIYKGITYTYKVVDIYDIEKTGKAEIARNKDINTLTLITCRHGTNKQIVIICELKS